MPLLRAGPKKESKTGKRIRPCAQPNRTIQRYLWGKGGERRMRWGGRREEGGGEERGRAENANKSARNEAQTDMRK